MSERTLVGFAGASVELVRRDAAAAQLAQFIFRRFPPAADAAPPCVRLDLAQDGTSTFRLLRDGSEVYAATPAGTAAVLLLAEAIHRLVRACSEGILLHAAGVAPSGHGILLPGQSGAGKSTLAAWLDQRGVPCLGDEIIAVADGGNRLIGFPRPICLEHDARVALPEIVEQARGDGRLLEAEHSLLLSPCSLLRARPVALERIVFPRYEPGATIALRPLSKAEAALRLMASLVHPGELPEPAFVALTDLVRRAPAFELSYRRLDDDVAQLLIGSG